MRKYVAHQVNMCRRVDLICLSLGAMFVRRQRRDRTVDSTEATFLSRDSIQV